MLACNRRAVDRVSATSPADEGNVPETTSHKPAGSGSVTSETATVAATPQSPFSTIELMAEPLLTSRDPGGSAASNCAALGGVAVAGYFESPAICVEPSADPRLPLGACST